MQKYIRLIVLVLSGCTANLLSAQTTILEQSLLTTGSFNTFTTVNVTGPQTWTSSSIYGALCSGYTAGQNFDNEDWLISPAINLSQTDNVKLTFSHSRGGAALVNVGVAEGWYKVFATADYTGDPATTAWTELEGFNQTLPAAWQYITSGELLIPEVAKSAHSRIAFRYSSSATQSATWEIRNVKITGDPQPTSPNAGLLKITNWNTEWLGCTQFGPTDETLQINNVVAAMLAMNADIYCLQEITNTAANPSIETLITLMGSDQWEGSIVPAVTDECGQRQGIIYRKSKVQLVSAALLSTGNPAQGNSYFYNWSNGRYPARYRMNLIAGNTMVPITLVNIHAKAEDGNASSYTRRLGASEALKTLLDGPAYNTEKVVLVGDFNDYFTGTTSTACGCTDSPYANFINDQTHYSGITQDIIDANTSFGTHPLIENFVISEELFQNYIPDSAVQEVSVYQNTANYFNTTSDHLPVSATFQFAALQTPAFTASQTNRYTIFPNPVSNQLQFTITGMAADTVTAIYDLTGRQMHCDKINVNTINVATFPAGVYILKVGSRSARFIKE